MLRNCTIKRKWCWTKYCAKEREESYLSSVSSNWSEISPGLELQLWIYLQTVLHTCAMKVKDQPIGLLTSDHNEASKNQPVKMPKVKAYPRCSTGRMHFTGTKILCGWQKAVLILLTGHRMFFLLVWRLNV